MIDAIYTNYVIYGLGGTTLLQAVALGVLLRQRRNWDLSRLDGRLSRFGEALALLTDTTQSGFATIAGELERSGRQPAASTSRTAASKRIVASVRRGQSVQQVAADEQVSESEVRLHLGLANPFATSATDTATAAPVVHDRPTRPRPSRRVTSRQAGA